MRSSTNTESSTPPARRANPESASEDSAGGELDAWPTTFFLGRDGMVHGVHAGFAAKASGEYNAELKREVTGTVGRLLSENVVASR